MVAMTSDKDDSVSTRLPAIGLSTYQEQAPHLDEVAARRGHSSALAIGTFGSLRGRPPSGREIAVLQFVAEGLTNREIAIRLGVSGRSVKTDIQRIVAKLEARNRTHAVTLGDEQGWIGLRWAERALTVEGWTPRCPDCLEFKLPTHRQRTASAPTPSAQSPAVDAEEATSGVLARNA
jgi:DNA-binding CsgD family transcriptional regulator